MRQPKADILPASANLVVLPLDVTDPGSIAEWRSQQAGEIDVLVNNAGFGAAVPIEVDRAGDGEATVRDQYARHAGDAAGDICPAFASAAAAWSSTSRRR